MTKSIKLYGFLFFILSCDANADVERNLFYTSTALILLDWQSTSHLVTKDKHDERNIILGRNPTRQQIRAYFLGALTLNFFCYELLKKEYKKNYLITVILIESITLTTNYTTHHARFQITF